MSRTALVIGSGFGGLASAILLARDGYQVHVYEKNECLGGRASILERDGFRRDMGPSWYLMPDVFEHFFRHIGEDVHQHLNLQKLTPSYRIFFEKPGEMGSDIVDMVADPEQAADILETLEPGVRPKFLDYLAKSEYQYRIGMKFVYKNYDSILDFFTREIAREGMKLKVFTNLYNYIRTFFRSPKVQKIMQYPLVFLGTSPYDAPALYNIMSHVDFSMGVFYPQGGIHEIVTALHQIGLKYGVQYHLNTPVTQIITQGKHATGIQIRHADHSHETIQADIVVANADMAFVQTQLLDEAHRDYPASYRAKKTMAPSGFIMYLGVNKRLPKLEHHNLIFCDDRKANFADIFEHHVLPDNPSLYVCKPSHTDSSVAPEGQENLFVLVPIPCGITITPEQQTEYKKRILTLIEERCEVTFQDDIVQEHLFDVHDFESRYNAYKGTALGLAHTLTQTAVLRPNNITSKVDNLYFVGHHTNPGIGMPMVLISALLMQERLKSSTSKHKY